ncbi:hypothetical protein B0A55_08765 [Friedmanniomyces simplex]|uniref:Small secreted protein n=1 Tax=Friedmanniomyces simplex TaxID=329884 RepID=A0A4U0X5L7_9PEZI|nr:hypothetical protein B0A55_08765 [Friedmanniomyces simplex]
MQVTTLLPFFAASQLLASAATLSPTQHLNVSVTAAENGQSVIQCWQLTTPPSLVTIGDVNFQSQSLGDLQGGSLNIFRPGLNLGLHAAPAKQWVIVLAGSIKVYLQYNQTEANTAFISAGVAGVLLAVDTKDVSPIGHITETIEQTALLFLPTANATVPEHTVLHNNVCAGQDLL